MAGSALPAAAASRLTGDLPRRADLGFTTGGNEGELEVRRVEEGSAAAAAGLRAGDTVVAVMGQAFAKPYVGQDRLRRLDGGAPVVLEVERDGRRHEVAFTPPPLPLETFAGLEAEYGDVTTPDGAWLRTILTRPGGASGPLPAIFLAQWVSCDTVEVNAGGGAWSDVIRGVAERSGMVLLRVERASGGDSEGPGCHELDYDTEVAHYRHALDQLSRHPWVDAGRLVLWGSSLGGTVAPLLAQGRPVAGVIVAGGGALTYFERMLLFDRIGFERGDLDPREIDGRMRRHAEFHVEYLLRGKTPEAIAAERPELADVWERIRGTGDRVHYGRPYSWHQQAAQKDFLAAWAAIAAPVLVLYAEYDQFELAHGHRTIAATRERLRPGSATYVELPQMAHGYTVHATPEDAAAWRRGTPAPELALGPMLRWLRILGLAGAPAEGS